MAAKTSLLNGLRKDLTCPICRILFEKPKLLPCLHDICADCLEKAVALQPQDPGRPIQCPLCKDPLGVANAQELPTNLTTQNMVKLLKKEDDARAGVKTDPEGPSMGGEPAERECEECDRNIFAVSVCSECNLYMCKACEDQHKVAKKTKWHVVLPIVPREEAEETGAPKVFKGLSHNPWRCDKHPESDVDMYCRVCVKVMCMKCAVCPPHKTHDYHEARDLVGDYYAQTDASVQQVADIHDRIRDATATVKGLADNLEDNKRQVKRNIAERHDKIVRYLEREKEKLLDMAEEIFDKKKTIHYEQLAELTAITEKLNDSLSYARRVRSEDNCIPVEFLALWETISNRMTHLHASYKDYDHRPWESDVIVFKPNDVADLEGSIGEVQGDPCPENYTATNVATTHFIQGKEAHLTFECRDIVGNVLKSPANPPNLSISIVQGGNRELLSKVANFVDKLYRVEVTPLFHSTPHAREHQMFVRALGVDIRGSPFDITVSPCVVQHGDIAPVRVVRSGNGHQVGMHLQSPFGVARSKDLIAVSDHTNMCVVICKDDVDHIQALKKEDDQLSSIRGVAFDSKGHLLTVEKEGHRVAVVNVHNNERNHIGLRGNGNAQFEFPSCVAVDSEGYIFVTDSMNQRVQYFFPDYTYAGQLGRWGQAIDEFHEPYGIALDGRDRLFVTSRKSHKVHIFERGRQPTQQNPLGYAAVCVFGNHGDEEQKLQAPVGITVDPVYGYVYVTEDGGSRVSVFTSNGEHVASFGGAGQEHGHFSHPMGVCVLENHNILVADSGNKQLVELCLLNWQLDA